MKLILSMIVRNESKIIERCLKSVVDKIDGWLICNTGSTDDTADKISNTLKSVPGNVIDAVFHNFAQARNEALEAAKQLGDPGDYILLIDADMEVQGSIDKSKLTEPAYRLKQVHDDNLTYWNTRLIRVDAGASYSGYTHEVLNVPVGDIPQLESLWIKDRNDGGSKSNKFQRDVLLLKQALEDNPNDVRSMFYLAESLRNSGKPLEAIPWYEKRIHAGGWDQEIWYSYYAKAMCYEALRDIPKMVYAYWEAFNKKPTRAEPLFKLARHYREQSKHEVGAAICMMAMQIPKPDDILFVEEDVYDNGLAQELSIMGFYCQNPKMKDSAHDVCGRMTVHPNYNYRSLAQRNFTHYMKSATELFGAVIKQIDVNTDYDRTGGWNQMNPSVTMTADGLRLGVVRTVNYDINEYGEYPTRDNSGIIKTRNFVASFDPDWNVVGAIPIIDATEVPKTSFPVEGFEDCRLFMAGGQLYVSTTVRDRREDGMCEIAILKLKHDHDTDRMLAIDMDIVRDYHNDRNQKNWMPVVGREVPTFVYGVQPTIVIERREGRTIEIVNSAPVEHYEEFRGSSHVVPFKDGYLSVIHEVTWMPKRLYTHRFVYFNADLTVRSVSTPFYFMKKSIEFCAGLAVDGDKLIVSFGHFDASAQLAIIPVERIEKYFSI